MESDILCILMEYGKLTWSQTRDKLWSRSLPPIEKDSFGVTISRYQKNLRLMGLITKKGKYHILTRTGYYEAYKIITKQNIDELNIDQLKAFEFFMSWYKNRSIIRAPINATPLDYIRGFLDLIKQVDEKTIEDMLGALHDIVFEEKYINEDISPV